jgi:hypothetical protein
MHSGRKSPYGILAQFPPIVNELSHKNGTRTGSDAASTCQQQSGGVRGSG